MVVQEYLLNYLLEDETKHANLLKRLEGIKRGMLPSPQHTDSALYPTIGQIERAAGFSRDDSWQAKLDKLDALLAQSSTSARDVALVAEMLSLPNDGRYPVLELAPQQRRQQTLEALVSQVATLSRQNPVLMVFEDVQWTDPTSTRTVWSYRGKDTNPPRAADCDLPAGVRATWTGRPYVTALTINRLGQREVSAMIDRVVGNKSLRGERAGGYH